MPSEHYLTERRPLAGIFQSHLAEALKNKGHNVCIVSAGLIPARFVLSYPYKPNENYQGIKIYRLYRRLCLPGRLINKLFYQKIVSFYLKLFHKCITENFKPHLVHAHNCLFAGIAARQIKRRFHVPYIITEHSSIFMHKKLSYKHKELISTALTDSAVNTVVSNALKKKFYELFPAEKKPFHTVFNIIEKQFVDINENTIRKFSNKTSSFVFLNVASLDRNKNQAGLLRAFSKAFKGQHNLKLKLVGHGSLMDSLKNLTSDLGIEKQVEFLGLLGRRDILQEFLKCNAFVLSSYHETFGVSLIEALACGKPVISTRCGGPEDIVDESNGLLVPPGDVESMAYALREIYQRILNGYFDCISIRSKIIQKFGPDAIVDKLEKYYLQAIS